MLLFPKLHGYAFCFVRTYQNNNCSNYCYYYYYNDSNEARSQRLHGKLRWYFINIVNRCLLKRQHFIINTDIELVIMKDRVTFYLRIEKKKRDLLVHIVVAIHPGTAIIHLALASTQLRLWNAKYTSSFRQTLPMRHLHPFQSSRPHQLYPHLQKISLRNFASNQL